MKQDTYILSERLGRGKELSDEEFEWFYDGRHENFTPERLKEVAAIIITPPWLKEVAGWKTREREGAADYTPLPSPEEIRARQQKAIAERANGRRHRSKRTFGIAALAAVLLVALILINNMDVSREKRPELMAEEHKQAQPDLPRVKEDKEKGPVVQQNQSSSEGHEKDHRREQPIITPKATQIARGLVAYRGSWTENGRDLPGWTTEILGNLRHDPEVSRSSGNAIPAAIELTAPDHGNVGLPSQRPVFRWQSVDGVNSYRVRIEKVADDQGTIVDTVVSEPHFEVGEELSLEEGSDYRLTITTQVDDPTTGTEPISGSFVFRVLTAKEQTRLSWALKNASDAPVTAAMVMYQLGMYADAQKVISKNVKNLKAVGSSWGDKRLSKWRKELESSAALRRRDPSQK